MVPTPGPELPSARADILIATDSAVGLRRDPLGRGRAGHHRPVGPPGRGRARGDEPRPADLAIVDIQIGTMGGIAVALDLRLEADAGRLEPGPVLLVLDRRPDVFMARRSGAEGWILKPLDPIRLRKAVAALLAGRDLARHQLSSQTRWSCLSTRLLPDREVAQLG